MSIDLVTATTADGVELDGAIYRPPAEAPRRGVGVVMVHGLTWNFYRGPSRWLPPLLTRAGFPCLSLNMRDHDLAAPKDFSLAHHDLRAGLDAMARDGVTEVVLLAHGFACNKLVCYAAASGDQRPRRQILTTFGAVKAYRPEIWDEVIASAPKMRGATLVIQGADDELIEARERAAELIAAAPGAEIEVELLEGANHYFNERREALARSVVAWLERTAP
jgi:predicted alpha/beta hydrolase